MPEFINHQALDSLNTLGLPCSARYFCTLSDINELPGILAFSATHEVPTLVLGGGSNVVLSQDYDGLVVHNRLLGIH